MSVSGLTYGDVMAGSACSWVFGSFRRAVLLGLLVTPMELHKRINDVEMDEH